MKPVTGAAIVAIVIFGVFGYVKAHDWWIARQATVNEQLKELARQVDAKNKKIDKQEQELVTLRLHQKTLELISEQKAKQADSSAKGWASARVRLDSIAAANKGTTLGLAISEATRQADMALLDCQNLGKSKDLVIQNLKLQQANQDTTKKDLKDVVVLKDSTITAVKALIPPWWKRTLSWIGSNSTSLAVGVVVGVVASPMIRP